MQYYDTERLAVAWPLCWVERRNASAWLSERHILQTPFYRNDDGEERKGEVFCVTCSERTWFWVSLVVHHIKILQKWSEDNRRVVSAVAYVGYEGRNAVKASDQTVEVLPGGYLIRALSTAGRARGMQGGGVTSAVWRTVRKTKAYPQPVKFPACCETPSSICCVYMKPPLLLIVSQLNTGETLKFCLRFVTNQCLVQDSLTASLVTDWAVVIFTGMVPISLPRCHCMLPM